MIEVIQQLMHLREPEQLMQLDLSQYTDLAFGIYWKDISGHYLGCNDYLAHQGGYQEKTTVLGLTDYDLAWSKEAENYVANDTQVIKKQTPASFIETGTQFDNSVRSHFSHKIPLITRSHKVAGIIGISFMLDKDNILIPERNEKPSAAPKELSNNFLLSKQQMDCLLYLVLGQTMKEIGEAMKLSPKTVEHYLDAVKHKLQCHTRSALVRKALTIPYIKMKLMDEYMPATPK